MASGRFVSTSIADDNRLSKLSLTAELLYLKTIPHLDRDGMITGRAGALWGRVCPLRDELIGEMQSAIDEWVKVGLVTRMDTDDGPVLFFPGFLKNNNLLHYDRERPSRFPVPPGYERTDLGLILEGAEPKKKATKKAKEAPIPPSSNGNGAEVQDKVKDLRQDKVKDFALQEEDKDQEQDQQKEKGDRARDPYTVQPKEGEYIPGVPLPHWNQAKRNCDHFTAEARKHNVGPEPFRLMVDAVLDATGKTSLANTTGERGQKVLNEAKQTVIELCEMGRRTIEDVGAVLVSWREHDYRGASPPTFAQVVEHASAMAAGTHITKRQPQDGGKKEFASLADYNDWAARNDPQFKRIKEGILVKGTTVKYDNYRPARTH